MTQMKSKCTKGWFDRCSHAESRRCTCECGGANHGREVSGLGVIRRMLGGVAIGTASLFRPNNLKDYKKFIEVKRRKRSPELDFGVNWYRANPREWPLWRVSWIERTGELYATDGIGVEVLGIVKDKMTLDELHKKNLPYSELKIEKVLKGWADHHEIGWIKHQLA